MEWEEYKPIQELISEQRELFKQILAECDNKTMNYETLRIIEEFYDTAILNIIGVCYKQFKEK